LALNEAGVRGTPDPLVLLSRALETAKAGDVIVVAAYGEGADALVFRATAALETTRPRSIADGLARGIPLPSYEKYLKSRNVIPIDYQGEPFPTYLEWKELKQDVRLYGSRCRACGLVQYPIAQACLAGNARPQLTERTRAPTG